MNERDSSDISARQAEQKKSRVIIRHLPQQPGSEKKRDCSVEMGRVTERSIGLNLDSSLRLISKRHKYLSAFSNSYWYHGNTYMLITITPLRPIREPSSNSTIQQHFSHIYYGGLNRK